MPGTVNTYFQATKKLLIPISKELQIEALLLFLFLN